MKDIAKFLAKRMVQEAEERRALLLRDNDYWSIYDKLIEIDNRILVLLEFINELRINEDVMVGFGSLVRA